MSVNRFPNDFSEAEQDTIRGSILASKGQPMCPRCGESLETGLPVAGGGTIELIWQIGCAGCETGMLVTHLPRSD